MTEEYAKRNEYTITPHTGQEGTYLAYTPLNENTARDMIEINYGIGATGLVVDLANMLAFEVNPETTKDISEKYFSC